METKIITQTQQVQQREPTEVKVVQVTLDPVVQTYTEAQIDQQLVMANKQLVQAQNRVADLQKLKDQF
jgi:hypothetical protein